MQYYKKEFIVIVSLLLLLLSANVYTMLFSEALFDSINDRIWYLLVVAIGYVVGVLLLDLRTFFIVAGILQMSVLPIEISSLYLNHQPVSMPYMHWIISTNRAEACELLTSIWWLVIIVIAIWGLYAWLVTNIPAKWAIRDRKRSIGWCVFGVMVVALLSMHFDFLRKDYVAPSKRVYVRIYAWSFGMRMGNVFPYDIYLQTFRAMKHQREIDGIASLSDYQFGITPRFNNDSALYVLVIGEAARFDNFSIYGEYKRETNPLLAHQSNLICYTNAYAEANATDLSVPLMLTRATATNPNRAYNEKTVLGAFQEGGYDVAWLSAKSSPIRYLQHVLPTFDTTWIASGDIYDEVLVEPFVNLIQQNDEATNKLIVLHTKGSHLNYQDRYPQSFAMFEPCLKPGSANGMFDKELMTNTYDNSIVYTDFILNSLIQILDSTQRCACLIYMPDHGENLCDDDRNLWAHGSYDGSMWEYHVPLIVWYSDLFKSKYPEKVAALEVNKDKQLTSQVLFYTLCDMANLNEVIDSRYSLFSDSLEEVKSIQVLNGKGEMIELFGDYRNN